MFSFVIVAIFLKKYIFSPEAKIRHGGDEAKYN